MFKIPIYIRFIFSYVIFFPAVIIHELLHTIAALLTFSTITKFSLFPKIEFYADGSYKTIYGSVSSVPIYNMFYIIISLAPILMWLFAYIALFYADILYIGTGDGILYVELNTDAMTETKNLPFIYAAWQLFWGGFPSSQDFKMALNGFFSMSFIVTALLSITILLNQESILKAFNV